MKIYCYEPKLFDILNSVNPGILHKIEDLEQDGYNHIDYIFKIAPFLNYIDDYFCFRYYSGTFGECSLSSLLKEDYTDFNQHIINVHHNTYNHTIEVNERILRCTAMNNEMWYEIWADDFSTTSSIPDVFHKKVVDNYHFSTVRFDEPKYVIPTQLITNMA